MSGSKHTPGPWVVETATKGFDVCTLHGVERQPTEDGLGQSWVHVRPDSMFRDGEWHWPDEAEQLANARLIAAAPDLLIAVQRCLNFIEGTEAEFSEEFECGNIARAAIAKAEGRS